MLGDPEVGEDRPIPFEEDIGGLHIAVDDPLRVGVIERASDLLHQIERRREAAEALQALIQRAPGDQFGHEVEGAVIVAEVVDAEDVGVAQARGDPRLLAEALHEGRVARQARVDQLDRHEAIERGLIGAAHRRHPPAPQAFAQFIAPGEYLPRPSLAPPSPVPLLTRAPADPRRIGRALHRHKRF